MSVSDLSSLTDLSGLTDSSSLPVINQALEPAAIRNGNQAAKNAYQVGLAFEQMLVNELSQELTNTVSGDSSDDGTDSTDDSTDSTDDTTGLMGSDPASSTYAQMLPDALTSSVMSGGGLGIAAQIAASIDPALQGKV